MKQRRGTNLIINYKNLEIKNYKKLLIKKNNKKKSKGQARPAQLAYFVRTRMFGPLFFFCF
jgi:hypothetical protein